MEWGVVKVKKGWGIVLNDVGKKEVLEIGVDWGWELKEIVVEVDVFWK